MTTALQTQRLALLAVAALLVAGLAVAQEPAQAWQPPPPAPDEFDWIQLTSSEWLKGELIALYNDSLEFDSDELDKVTLDWEDVRLVRTARIMEVRFLGQPPVKGRLFVDGDVVRIVGDEERQFDRADLLTIAAGEPTELSHWSGKVSFGANLRRGNTEQVEINTVARGLRRTVRNRIGLEYLGNYNVTNDVSTANNQRLNGDVDWFVSDRLFIRPLQLEYYKDPFQNIAQRWTVGAAVGYQLVDTSRVGWSVGVGPAYQHTTFDSVAEGASDHEATPALLVRTTYTNELTGKIDYRFDYAFSLTSQASGRYNHHLVTGVEIEGIAFLDLDLTLVWDRIQAPRPTETGEVPKKDDYRLIVGLGFDF